MNEPPETKYAWNGDVALAYQVLGDGPVDLIYYQGYCSHVDVNWESPRLSRFLGGSHACPGDHDGSARMGVFGAVRADPTFRPLEAFTDDLIAVMDAAGSERAAIFATSECGLVAALFAATHPGRAAGLILCDAWVTYQRTDETPWMYTTEEWEAICDAVP